MSPFPAATTFQPAPLPGGDFDPACEFFRTGQVASHYEVETGAVWMRMAPTPRPCFNTALLHDIGSHCRLLAGSGGRFHLRGEVRPIECSVFASATPGIFNFGGDLEHILRLIDRRDRTGLTRYGHDCIGVLFRNHTGHAVPLQTVTLVQGECLGGGFEAALSSDLVVAERSSRFGLPEILFNMFPGMGGYSFLARRVGPRCASELVASGKILSAAEMRALGAIDLVVDDGTGAEAVTNLLIETRRSRNGLVGAARARRRINGVSWQELVDVVGIWVESALMLTPRDLRVMQRLVTRQSLLAGPAPAAVPACD
jgi:DSF synthase